MTTEDDFQAALDAAPEDYQTRLVFADRAGHFRGPNEALTGSAATPISDNCKPVSGTKQFTWPGPGQRMVRPS